jgi:hypothetical protein
MKKIISIALVSVFLFCAAAPLTAGPQFGTQEWNGSQEQKRFNESIASNTDTQNEGVLQMALGMVCVSGGAVALVMPLVSMGEEGANVPVLLGVTAGGALLTIIGIWQLTEAFPKMASIPGLKDSKLVYAPVITRSGNSLAHCIGVNSAF